MRAIHVRDGQSVKAGDVLIELDPTMTTAEQEHIRSDLIAAQLDIARLRAALSDSDDPEARFSRRRARVADLVAMQRQFLVRQTEEYRAKLASLDRPAGAEGGRTRYNRGHDRASSKPTEPIIKQRVDILKDSGRQGTRIETHLSGSAAAPDGKREGYCRSAKPT